MSHDGLEYCRAALREIQQRIWDIEAELPRPARERALKRALKDLKVIEKHLTQEVRRMEQLALFPNDKEA
jgi:cob(I)alamin adenosyltransferase